MVENLLNILFPPSCVICGKIGRKWICPRCKLEMKNELKYCRIKKKNKKIFFVSFYEGKIRKLLLEFKFTEKPHICNFFAEIISSNEKFSNYIKEYDYIIPVPMFIDNKKLRGYNQSELIAKKLSKKIGVECITDCLEKVKKNQKQSRLTETERAKNVRGVYKIKSAEKIRDKSILLLDDIYTTGSTVGECKRELRVAKPKKIDVLVMAKTK